MAFFLSKKKYFYKVNTKICGLKTILTYSKNFKIGGFSLKLMPLLKSQKSIIPKMEKTEIKMKKMK